MKIFKILQNNRGAIGGETRLTNTDGTPLIAVAGVTTVYSRSFKIGHGSVFGVGFKAASSGVINLKIELEQSWDGSVPTTEGSSDTDFVVGEGVTDIHSALTDTTARLKLLSPVPGTYARLKITGGTGNDASTTLDVYVFQQEG